MCSLFHIHRDRGWKFFHEDKFEEAIAEWRVAADLDPEDGYVLAAIGEALSKLGQSEAAFTEWREAVHLEPEYEVPYICLADALLEKGYASKALATIRAAVRLCPPSANLYIRLGHYLATQADENSDKAGCEAAAEAFQQAIDIEPANSYARRHLARTQWVRGKKREAIRTLKDAVQVDPNDAEAHIQLWNYQSRAWNFRGMIRTTYAIEKLPDSEALNEHYADINNLWPQTQRTLLLIVGVVTVLGGVWIWNRRRRDA